MNCNSIIPAVILLQALAASAAVLPPSDRSTNGPAASATPTSGTSGLTLESFHIIPDRNIFNPNRSGRTPEREYTRREERRTRVESFALVGTLGYDKGYFAFFDGSNSEFRKALKADDTIAGFIVTAVTPEKVTLQSTNHGDYALPIGMQLQRVDDGKWEVAPRTQTSSNGSGLAGSSGRTSSSTFSSGAGSDEVAKRLMQQREQEGAVNPAPLNETPPTPSPTSTSASSADDEIVRRMMQRREQETNK